MKTVFGLLLSTSLLLAASGAQAFMIFLPTATLQWHSQNVSDFTTNGPCPCYPKIIAAKEDAALFIASEGAVNTANLRGAFQSIREFAPEAKQNSDLELSQWILAQ